MVDLLKKINAIPLDQIHPQDADSVSRAIRDQVSEELPVPVAKFGSSI